MVAKTIDFDGKNSLMGQLQHRAREFTENLWNTVYDSTRYLISFTKHFCQQ